MPGCKCLPCPRGAGSGLGLGEGRPGVLALLVGEGLPRGDAGPPKELRGGAGGDAVGEGRTVACLLQVSGVGVVQSTPLARLPARVGALASAPSGGHWPCRSLPPSRPLPPPPLSAQPPQSRRSGATSRQRPRPAAAAAPSGRHSPPKLSSARSSRGLSGGPGAARGCSGAPRPRRPPRGPSLVTVDPPVGRERGHKLQGSR